jgi:hypothetical protein
VLASRWGSGLVGKKPDHWLTGKSRENECLPHRSVSMPQLQVWTPLLDFEWEGNEFELASRLCLRKRSTPPALNRINQFVSKDELDRLRDASHWLEFTHDTVELISDGELANLFLLSLWLRRETRTQAPFRFVVDSSDGSERYVRMLDRFAWIRGEMYDAFETSDLEAVSRYLPELRGFCAARERLNNALVLTLSGCWSNHWQTALSCHAAALETLLTYSRGPGITRRLATSYACIVEAAPATRSSAFTDFEQLYSIRSDITHGRTHLVDAGHRLIFMKRLSQALRSIWVKVIESRALAQALEGDDGKREAYLRANEAGFTPPPKT